MDTLAVFCLYFEICTLECELVFLPRVVTRDVFEIVPRCARQGWGVCLAT